MLDSLKAIQDEAEFGIKEGITQIGNAEASTLATNKYVFNDYSFLALANTLIKHVANKDIEFTADEVKDFLSRHPTREVNGKTFVSTNDKTKGVKDNILLVIYQAALLMKDEDLSKIRDRVQLKYLQVCQPAVYENIPEVKDLVDKTLEAHAKRVQDVCDLNLIF